ncbi:MAG: hypothetical protein ACTSUR_02570 [Candidatus Heimdallarchaeaceae archaeon]
MIKKNSPNINLVATLGTIAVFFFTLIVTVLLVFIEKKTAKWPIELWGFIYIMCCCFFAFAFMMIFNLINNKSRETLHSNF